jgi:hypothetical protein
VPTFDGGPIVGRFRGREIEGYARYEGQTLCDPDAKSGALGLRNLILAHYPTTTSFGIGRPCDMGGRSEHKEGRAFDWGADASDPEDLAAVQSFFRILFAEDAFGNAHALIRRMGVMYIIWDGHIWTSYAQEWQPYSGSSPHTDHVHISLSWAGALSQTSFWSGRIATGSYAPAMPRAAGVSDPLPPGSKLAPTPSPTPKATVGPTAEPTATPEATRDGSKRRRRRSTPAPTSPSERTALPTEAPTQAPSAVPSPA